MKKIYSFFQNKNLILIILGSMFVKLAAQPTTLTFSYTGGPQTFTVPSCVSIMTLDVKGGAGANAQDVYPNNSTGGLGGRAVGVYTTTPGTVLNIYVGGAGTTGGVGGYNGGGAGGLSSAGSGCQGGYAGGGGGASDIRVGGVALTNRIIVAGGGGGAGRDYCNGTCVPCGCGGSGGAGGGTVGVNGVAANNCGYSYPGTGVNYGSAGTQTAGGLGGPGDAGGASGSNGASGQGGAGAAGAYDVAGGGGGGGYYGGGGGGSASSGSGVGGGGGGGGSSYIVGLQNATSTPSINTGNGLVTITYNLGVIVPLVATNTAICNGNSVTITYSGATSYTWSNNSNSPSITVAPNTTTNYSVTGNLSGCTYSGNITITVSPGQPTLTVVTSTPQTCLGKTATLTASGALTYTWTNNVTNGVSFSPSVTTIYTVQGQNGCGITSATTSIIVAPLPVTASATSTLSCAGYPSTLTATAAATGYTWSPNNANASVAVVAPTVSTIYTITVSDGTCAGTTTVPITVNPIPTISIITTTNNNICAGSPAMITATGGISYTWTPGGQNGSLVTVTPTAATLYSVTGSNSFGCLSGANQVIIPQPAPNLVVSASSSYICPSDPVTITATGANSYTWVNPASNNAVINVNPQIPTIYTVSGSNTVPCVSTQTVLIDVFIQSVNISGSTVICNGKSTNLTGNGADNYTWNGASFSNGNSATFNPTVTTSYTLVTSTFTNGITCPYTLTFQIVVNPKPSITAVLSRTMFCKGETNTITANGAQTYTWTGGTNSQSIVISGSLAPTTQIYSVTGTSSLGCVNSSSLAVNISACAGIEKNFANMGVTVYPNPSKGEINITSPSSTELILTNEIGQIIRNIKLNESNGFEFKNQALSPGIYFISNREKEINIKVLISE